VSPAPRVYTAAVPAPPTCPPLAHSRPGARSSARSASGSTSPTRGRARWKGCARPTVATSCTPPCSRGSERLDRAGRRGSRMAAEPLPHHFGDGRLAAEVREARAQRPGHVHPPLAARSRAIRNARVPGRTKRCTRQWSQYRFAPPGTSSARSGRPQARQQPAARRRRSWAIRSCSLGASRRSSALRRRGWPADGLMASPGSRAGRPVVV